MNRKLSKLKKTQRRRLVVQPLESRRVLAASLGWDGPGLGNAELTYHIEGSPSSLSQAETSAAIETALAAWSSAANITFTPTDQPGLRDSIDFSFANIDGAGGTLAQAYFPDDVNPARIAGDVQFDGSESWEVGNALGNRAFDLVYVAVHEIGHSLGLDHTGLLGSVLAPFVSPNQAFRALPAVDVAAIQGLYASAVGATASDTPVVEIPVDQSPTTDTADTGDKDSNPFPRNRWFRGGNWHRFGGRLDTELVHFNYVNPTDVNGDNTTSALDALMIINQLSRGLSNLGGESSGLCDANGDGVVSALDALTVINAMNSLNVSSLPINSIVIVDDTTIPVDKTASDDTTDSVVDTADPVDDNPVVVVDDTTDPVDDNPVVVVDDTTDLVDDNPVVVVDDATDPVDDNPVVVVVDTTDPVDETPVVVVDDTTDPVDDNPVVVVDDTTDPVDDTDGSETPIDDGGVIDDTDDTEVEDTDEHDCHTGDMEHHSAGHHGGGRFGKGVGLGLGLFNKSAEGLVSRFDSNGDGSLAEDELPARVWATIVDRNVDADSDGIVTLTEIQEAIDAARQEAFAAKDTDADGLLTEAEVNARFWTKVSGADTDADGGVSFSELETYLETLESPLVENTQQGQRVHDEVFSEIGKNLAGTQVASLMQPLRGLIRQAFGRGRH